MGVFPITAASAALGVMAFMNAGFAAPPRPALFFPPRPPRELDLRAELRPPRPVFFAVVRPAFLAVARLAVVFFAAARPPFLATAARVVFFAVVRLAVFFAAVFAVRFRAAPRALPRADFRAADFIPFLELGMVTPPPCGLPSSGSLRAARVGRDARRLSSKERAGLMPHGRRIDHPHAAGATSEACATRARAGARS